MMIKAKNTLSDASGSIVWQARLCFSPCTRTISLFCTREEPNFHPEFCLRDVTDGMRSPWNFMLVVSKKFPGSDHNCKGNCVRIQPIIGLIFIQVLSRTLVTSVVAGV